MSTRDSRDTNQIVEALYRFAEEQSEEGVAIRLPKPYDEAFSIDDTGIDSLSAAALAVHLETRFSIEISFTGFLRAKTLGDVVQLVSDRLDR